MAAPAPQMVPVGPDTLITVKVLVDGTNRRFKLALRDLGPHVLPLKLRILLVVPPEADVVFERFSDSAESYVALDSNNPAIYKQLYRAAKAKLKLRIRATITRRPVPTRAVASNTQGNKASAESLQLPTPPKASPTSRYSYLDTVLSTSPNQDPKPAASPTVDAIDSAPVTMGACPSLIRTAGLASAIKAEQPTMVKEDAAPQLNSCVAGHQTGGQSHLDGLCSIDCNSCGKPVPDEHYHCGICDDGDFDLCPSCIAAEMTCEGKGHWLIKRRIKDGRPVSSTTETIAPKKRSEDQSFETEEKGTGHRLHEYLTCNSCINEIIGEDLVTCTNCADYDLCITCFSLGDHGHHPGHRFRAVSAPAFKINPRILSLCTPGRGVAHAATCDGCDKHILGVRHKCVDCPDWDYCSTCVLDASQNHPGHRFVPLYEEISEPVDHAAVHYGIYCDGPLCVKLPYKQYIRGTRYKCSICHDTDFCANCEAVPSLVHNQTHPLIKFKTPVRHVAVTTLEETDGGRSLPQMGDIRNVKDAAADIMPPASSITTVAEGQSVRDGDSVDAGLVKKVENAKPSKEAPELQAHFESDALPDGSSQPLNSFFSQSWTLRNPGPHAWPAGCAVYFTGGDHMLNVDTKNPSSVTAMAAATKSSVADDSVQPGKTATFDVVLKSPEREGRLISYWRLKTPDGIPFGHKLWVDVKVTKSVIKVAPAARVESPPAADRETKVEKTEEKSTMIFPKLNKESATSSVQDVGPSVTREQEVVRAKEGDVEELIEDVVNVNFDEEETDDGFLTDEEYDILDASDEDLLMEAQKAINK